MEEALKNLLPEQLDPYASVMVGAVGALVIFAIGWILSKWTQALVLRGLRRQNVDEALSRFLGSIAQYLVLAATAITALGKVGVEATSLVALLGTAGLAIGLALQGSLSNCASGVMILVLRPFTIGDRVTAAGQSGTVTNVGLFTTTLKTPNGEVVMIPNSEITSSAITNFNSTGTLRFNVDIGVAYGTNYHEAEKVILEAVSALEGVHEEPAPAVVFNGFGASSLDFIVRAWTDTADVFALTHQARIAIYEALEKAEIEIPFDQVVVHKAES